MGIFRPSFSLGWSRAFGGGGGGGGPSALPNAIAALTPEYYYKLDDASSPFLNSGSIAGTITGVGATAAGTVGPDGRDYVALATSGDAYLNIPDNTALTPGATGMTVVFMYRSSDLSAFKYLMGKAGASNSSREWYVVRNVTRLRGGRINTAGGIYSERTGDISFVVDEWSMIAVTFTNNTVPALIYMNGVSENAASVAATGTPTGDTTSAVCIGAFRDVSGGGNSSGQFAHVAIWDHVLSPSEITALATAATASGWI